MESLSRSPLVMVSAGLGLDGGGRALAGRLMARGASNYAVRNGIPFEVLSLGSADEPRFAEATQHFAGNRLGLARAVARAQRSTAGRRPALIFDLLGLARVQAVLPRRRRAPYLVALYGVDVWRRLAWDRRRALHGAGVQLAISRTTIERARPFTGALEHAMLVRLTLEPDTPGTLGAVDQGLLDRLGSDYVLIVGRMAGTERYKGHDELLRALPQVLQSHPQTRLVIVGDGDDRARLERAAADLGLSRQVTFTGFVNEATLREIHRRAAIFAMPSTGEGFGLVYLEAMRAGIPCVAAKGSVAVEVMIDGESGVLVDAGDPADLGAALVRLLGDSSLRARIGAAGRERFESEWSYPRFEESLDAALDRLTGRSDVRN